MNLTTYNQIARGSAGSGKSGTEPWTAGHRAGTFDGRFAEGGRKCNETSFPETRA